MKGWWRAFLEGPLTGAAIRVGHLILLALGSTWRIRHVGGERVDRVRLGRGSVLYAFTHGVLLPLAFTHRNRDSYILVSASRDGEIISRVTDRLGFRSVRGSSTRGGSEALAGLCAKVAEGHDAGITPDGPRGPRGSVQPGVLIVAARTGAPIVPLAAAAGAAWRARSWDRFLIPKPFARVYVVYGHPISVDDTEGESGRRRAEELERTLAAVEQEAERYARDGSCPAGSRRVPA